MDLIAFLGICAIGVLYVYALVCMRDGTENGDE